MTIYHLATPLLVLHETFTVLRHTFCRYINSSADRVVVELNRCLPVIIGRHLRIPVKRASVVFYLGQLCLAIVRIVVLCWSVEALEIINTTLDVGTILLINNRIVDEGIDSNRPIA